MLKRRKAFTLMEVLVVIGIFSVFLFLSPSLDNTGYFQRITLSQTLNTTTGDITILNKEIEVNGKYFPKPSSITLGNGTYFLKDGIVRDKNTNELLKVVVFE